MLSFSDICTYQNNFDFTVYGPQITFPSDLPGAKFIDGWIRVPAAYNPYNLDQVYVTQGSSSSDPVSYTIDWTKSGTAVSTGGYFEPLDEQGYRNAVVSRFGTKPLSLHLKQHVRIRQHDGDRWQYIDGAYFQLRIGADAYTVSDIASSSNCMDNPITVTWTVAAQNTHVVDVINSQGAVVYQATRNSTTPSHTIPAGTLPPGNYTVRVQSGYDLSAGLHCAGVGLATPIQTMPLTIWRIEPKIIAFEPDGVAQNREQPISVTWASENQHSYVLKVKQGNQVVKEYTGTTGKTETIPANTLASGITTLDLTLKYTPTWGTEANAVYATDIINFDAYGTPPVPVLTMADTVATAFPQITWTSSEQYYFRLKVLKGEAVIQDTGEVPSELQQYTLTKPLENGNYTIKLAVKNRYGIYSAEASKVLSVSYVLPQKPEIYCSGNDENGSISIRVFNADAGNFAHCDLFKKLDGEWVRIAKEQPEVFEYIDYLVKPDATYEYMARAIGSSSGFQDSDSKQAKTSILSTQLFEPDKPENPINLRLEPSREETAHRSVHFMTYAGMHAPTVEFGEEQYSTVAASFFARIEDGERLKQLYFTASTLCYRDNRGRLLYGFISSDPKIKDSAYGWCAVSFNFTQTLYTEGI